MPGPGTGPRPGGWETLVYRVTENNGPLFPDGMTLNYDNTIITHYVGIYPSTRPALLCKSLRNIIFWGEMWWHRQCRTSLHWVKGCIVPVRAMKAYRGRRIIAPLILDLGTWWRWVVNFKTCPLTPGKNPGTDWKGDWVGPTAILNGFGAQIIFSPPMRLKPLMVQLLV